MASPFGQSMKLAYARRVRIAGRRRAAVFACARDRVGSVERVVADLLAEVVQPKEHASVQDSMVSAYCKDTTGNVGTGLICSVKPDSFVAPGDAGGEDAGVERWCSCSTGLERPLNVGGVWEPVG